MYKAPNGMVFESYEDSMQYNQKEIQKELEEILGENKEICPRCGKTCLKTPVREVYVCGSCGLLSFSKFEEDENENEVKD